MSELNITITGNDDLDVAAAHILVAQAFINVGALNIETTKLSAHALSTLEKFIDPDIIARCRNSCKIIIN